MTAPTRISHTPESPTAPCEAPLTAARSGQFAFLRANLMLHGTENRLYVRPRPADGPDPATKGTHTLIRS